MYCRLARQRDVFAAGGAQDAERPAREQERALCQKALPVRLHVRDARDLTAGQPEAVDQRGEHREMHDRHQRRAQHLSRRHA